MKLKVYGGCYDGRHRVIVAAKSKKEAHRLVQTAPNYRFLSYYGWNRYTSDTGNDEELQLALSEPGAVFEASVVGRGTPYRKISP